MQFTEKGDEALRVAKVDGLVTQGPDTGGEESSWNLEVDRRRLINPLTLIPYRTLLN